MSEYTPNWNRVCGGCAAGSDCWQPYVSDEGTTYYCTQIEEEAQ